MKKIIFISLFCVSVVSFFSFQQKPKFDLKTSIARGKEIYAAQCITCHMEQGEGMEGAFPPLAKSNYLANRDRLIKIIVKGVRGPMTVNGVAYDGEMVGFTLTDEQTSDVINYIRNSWGNKHAAVTPGEIPAGLGTQSADYQPY
ncbi:c-type cytochrome [Chryseolinea lacunae]|uniref:Cytochrome c n=1 Tax=Chryseolinea lacunae TaxID=2801331 RepID=A0ABS1KSF9_9BACT|nr:cytochrome c [Chryseolinea lacunae]MBL0742395.1 cytochrome c [Chryseolinea lacunae]